MILILLDSAFKMRNNVLALQLVLLFYIRKTVAIPPPDVSCGFTISDVDCSSINVILDGGDGKFFEAVRKVESEGDLCKINQTTGEIKIGPYQISEDYYNDAACFNEDLKTNGSIWKHVWGSSSDEYSKQVIRSYICYHGTRVKRRRGGQLIINAIAAIHRGGSTDLRSHRDFADSVRQMVQSSDPTPNVSAEVCDPPCKQGECCMGNKCWCLNTTTVNVTECQACNCNRSDGAFNRRCDLITGQCDCRPDVTGRTCDTCTMEGYYGPIDRECRKCRCVQENTVRCNRTTGECTCKDGWIGSRCSTFNGTCPEHITGSNCDVCIVGYYGNPKNNILCQRCNCSDNNDLTVPGSCNNVNGKCSNCLNNTDGDNCHICADGYYGDAVNGVCIPCDCHPDGAKDQSCNRITGECDCNRRVIGKTCDHCRHGTWRFSNCQPCRCRAGRTIDDGGCDQENGQCHCLLGFRGLRCGRRDSLSAFRYSGSTYSSYTSKVPTATTAEIAAYVGLQNEDGILFYFSQYENGTGSYFLTQFINRTIELSFNIGGSLMTIRGEKQLPMNQFIRIAIAIIPPAVSIRITSDDAGITAPLEFIARSMSVTIVSVGTFYVGGVPSTHILPVDTPNFIGCIETLLIIILDNQQATPSDSFGRTNC